MKKLLAVLFAFLLLAAACGDDSDSTTTDPAVDPVPEEDMSDDDDMADDDMADDDMSDDDMSDDDMADDDMADDADHAAISANAQSGDGTTFTVSSISLPTAGFIAVHVDEGGSPGAVIGHSEVLPAGLSGDVEITLDTPLDADAAVWPMAHLDVNDNGVYDFGPDTDNTDVPATNVDGGVAMVSVDFTIG